MQEKAESFEQVDRGIIEALRAAVLLFLLAWPFMASYAQRDAHCTRSPFSGDEAVALVGDEQRSNKVIISFT